MIVTSVVVTKTIIVPDENTEDFKKLYNDWFENEGIYMEEDKETLPQGVELIKTLASFISEMSHVGEYEFYVSGEDVNIEIA